MSVNKINPVYPVATKSNGDTLSAAEWNELTLAINTALSKINEVLDEGIPSGGGDGGSSDGIISTLTDPNNADKTLVFCNNTLVGEITDKKAKGKNVTLAGNNNINIEPRAAVGKGDGTNSASDANRKGGNIALKPGDDIELWAHKRGTSKNDEVSVKVMTEVKNQSDPSKTDEVAAKLQLNTADIVITSKDKKEDSDITNITINQAQNTRGYLKVRAQAIDLRSETHGGIALQPRGQDSGAHENKIKFEHGGGDGLEFGTFNTEKTSIFTNEYRFNKNGIWKMATRQILDNTPGEGGNDKYKIGNIDPTTHYSYRKNTLDDFYDFFDASDEIADTNSIIKTANAFNYGKNRHAKYVESLNQDGTIKNKKIEVECVNTYLFVVTTLDVIESFVEIIATDEFDLTEQLPVDPEHLSYNTATGHFGTVYGTIGEGATFSRYIGTEGNVYADWNQGSTCDFYVFGPNVTIYNFFKENSTGEYVTVTTNPAITLLEDAGVIGKLLTESELKDELKKGEYELGVDIKENEVTEIDGVVYRLVKFTAPEINISSVQDISIKSKDGTLKLGGEQVNFDTEGVNFGELEQGLEYIYKSTKSGNRKQCDVLRVLVTNNTASSIEFTLGTYNPTNYVNFTDEDGDALEADNPIPTFCKDNVTIAKGKTVVVAQCSIYDIIKLVDYFKSNSTGPWASQ